jgi:hypothetical protein
MSTMFQRITSAYVVLFGKHGEVTKEARERGQSRQAVYREAAQVIAAVDSDASQARIAELEQTIAEQQARIQALEKRLERAVELTPEKQHEFAAVSQAEGVSLAVARRQLQVVGPAPVRVRSVATLGRATEDAGKQAGALLEVIDEYTRPKVQQLTADEIFLVANRS